MKNRFSGIYLLLDGETMPDLRATLTAALQGGIRIFQYREKRGANVELLRALYKQTQAAGALLTVNDNVELMELADGIHLGQDDLLRHPLTDLRAHFPDKIIGISAHSAVQAESAIGADYLGVGPFRATATKAVARQALGIEGVVAVARATSLPVCAIGGIRVTDIASLRAEHIAMAAVIGEIAHARDQVEASREIVEAWNAT